MDIFLLIDGQQHGPYTTDQVRKSLSEGLIPSDLMAWHEGRNDWMPISQMLEGIAPLPPIIPPPIPPAILESQRERGERKAIPCWTRRIAVLLLIGFVLPGCLLVYNAMQSPEKPSYIKTVIVTNAGINAVLVRVAFKDANNNPTSANGQVTVEVCEDDGDSYQFVLSKQTFTIHPSDFKTTKHILGEDEWSVTLPRITFEGVKSNTDQGYVEVDFIGEDGVELKGQSQHGYVLVP